MEWVDGNGNNGRYVAVAMHDSVKKLRAVEVEPDEFSLIKPGELVDVVELSPLTLNDRRIFNLLILNSWESITAPKEHCIHKRELRGSHNVNARVGDSITRLMGTIAVLEIERAGKPYTRRVQLLSTTDEGHETDGLLFYSFSAALRTIIKNSTQYAKLQKDVMFALSSKYALALYELVQKRGNLKHKTSEEFSLEKFRALLGVEKDKLRAFKSLKQRAIDPAVLEVNGLGEFGCKVEPIYKGRKVTAVRLSWWAKTLEEKKVTLRELRVSKIGRKARLLGTVETIAPSAPQLAAPVTLPEKGWSGLTEAQSGSIRNTFPGIDIQEMERQFVEWNRAKRVEPDNYCAALYGFIRGKLKQARGTHNEAN
ncbi:MAG: replication initiation protein [Acidobacteria bacterium]|nr:replication initiation protein [Acidobacteriota bacterium]